MVSPAGLGGCQNSTCECYAHCVQVLIGFDKEMDVSFEKFSLPFFLWYVMPGLNFCLLNLGIPILIYNPGFVGEISGLGEAVVIVLVSLAAGFILDSFKLYQADPRYWRDRKQFFGNLARVLGESVTGAKNQFEIIREIINDHPVFANAIAVEHSRWVMVSLMSKLFILLAIEMTISGIFLGRPGWTSQVSASCPWVGNALFWAVPIVSVLAGVRLGLVERHHRSASNEKYILFARGHQSEISAIIKNGDDFDVMRPEANEPLS